MDSCGDGAENPNFGRFLLSRYCRGIGNLRVSHHVRAVLRYPFPPSSFSYPITVAKTYRMISRVVADFRPNITNVHHASSGLAMALALVPEAPWVFFFHGPWHGEAMAKDMFIGNSIPLKYRLRQKIDSYVLSKSTAVVGLSEYMLSEAADLYRETTAKRVKIPSGVDTERFTPLADKAAVRRQLGLPEDGILLLSVRRLSPRMGLENLVRAMALVERERVDVHLLIGGRGEIGESLESLIVELGLKRTRLVGYISDEQLPAYYQASDLFIMPSVSLEGFGLTILEAMASGIPVLGTPVGGISEVLEQVTPDFVLSGVEPEQIAAGIMEKLCDLGDVDLQHQLRDHALNFSWKRIADSVERLFVELAEEK